MDINPILMVWVIIPTLIFFARIVDVTIGTLRIMFVARGMRYLAPLLGFFEVLIWLMAMRQIMLHLDNPVNYLAYAAGFGMGNFAGMWIENRIALGVSIIRVITRKEGDTLTRNLLDSGFMVTSVNARGGTGAVKILFAVVRRKQLKLFINKVQEFNPNAFYTIEDVNFVSKGLPVVTGSIAGLDPQTHKRK